MERERTRSSGGSWLRSFIGKTRPAPVTAAMDNIFNDDGQAPSAFSSLLDVVGYNYVDRWGKRRETHYADDRKRVSKSQVCWNGESQCAGSQRSIPLWSLVRGRIPKWSSATNIRSRRCAVSQRHHRCRTTLAFCCIARLCDWRLCLDWVRLPRRVTVATQTRNIRSVGHLRFQKRRLLFLQEYLDG